MENFKKATCRLLYWSIFPVFLLIVSCQNESASNQVETQPCFYKLNFPNLSDLQFEQLAEVSLNIHDNFFIYKNLDVNPIRFNETIYLSLDCDHGVEALELDDWMRGFIREHSKLNEISPEKYQSMYDRSISGKIVVE